MANNSLQGINDRIRAKFEKMKHLTREAAKITASQQMSIDGGAEVQSLRDHPPAVVTPNSCTEL